MKGKYGFIVGIVVWVLSSSVSKAIEDLHFKVQGSECVVRLAER